MDNTPEHHMLAAGCGQLPQPLAPHTVHVGLAHFLRNGRATPSPQQQLTGCVCDDIALITFPSHDIPFNENNTTDCTTDRI